MSGPGFVDGGTFSAAVACLPDHVTWLTLTSTIRALVLTHEDMLVYEAISVPLLRARRSQAAT